MSKSHKKRAKDKVKWKKCYKIYKIYATPVLTFSFGIVKWTPTDLENLQTKTKILHTRYRFYHHRAAKGRITLPRQIGGRELTDITRLHDK
jgi:hypothetical protein